MYHSPSRGIASKFPNSIPMKRKKEKKKRKKFTNL
jgi:hypothetical protein